MADARIHELLERNKAAHVVMAPPKIAQIRERFRSGPGGMVIISCSDPRVIPEQYFNLQRGEAAIIRNAGGRVSDALRSILTLDAIAGLAAILVIHHTDCGTSLVLDEEVREMCRKRAPGKKDVIDKMTFGETLDVDASIREDVKILKGSPYLSEKTKILGFKLDVETGLLTEVKEEDEEDFGVC